jgi:hypothetical protein
MGPAAIKMYDKFALVLRAIKVIEAPLIELIDGMSPV